MTTTRRSILFSLYFYFFVAQQQILLVSGYAAWLRCYVELDESEVIMHHHVIPPEEDDGVFVQVQAYGSEEWSSSSSSSSSTDNNKNTFVVTTTDTPVTIKVRLELPPHLERSEMQWIVEETAGFQQHLDGKNEGDFRAEFMDRGIMCDGTRAFSRNDDHVVLKINDLSEPIELVAGYAPGYEAVRLTPKFRIVASDYNDDDDDDDASKTENDGEGEVTNQEL